MNKSLKRVRIWDLPTRVFHWIFVASFIGAFLTRGDARYLDTHIFMGYLFGAMLLFRIVWGVVGTDYAKFSSFSFSPKSTFLYLKSLCRKNTKHFVGHNPAGSYAIYLMLILATGIAVSGLVVYAGLEKRGPLSSLFDFTTGAEFMAVHELFAWSMLTVIGLHVVGVMIESHLHHENLVKAMLNGYKMSTKGISSVPKYGWLAITIMFLVTSYAIVTYKGYLQATSESPYLPYQPVSLPQSEQWNEECGDCHIPFHPSLLPQRSWITLFKNQEDHFGDDLMLDEPVAQELLAFSMKNSSERHMTEAAWFIDTTTSLNKTFIRITETDYWQEQHAQIDNKMWKSEQVASKSQCEACHFDAKQGSFEDGAMRLPKQNKKKLMRVAWANDVNTTQR
jgi:cytochrome b